MKDLQISAVFPIAPVPAPRMVRSDKYRKRPCVIRYFNFRNFLVHYATSQNYVLSSPLIIHFYIEMPTSWSRLKRSQLCNTPHTSKPDLDNLVKAFMDALSKSDQYISVIHAEKYWSSIDKIIVFHET